MSTMKQAKSSVSSLIKEWLRQKKTIISRNYRGDTKVAETKFWKGH